MSHFIASSVTIDKKEKTLTFRGGDNNVTPRGNEKTRPITFRESLRTLAGNSIQFSSKKDFPLFIEETVEKIKNDFWDKGYTTATGFSETLWDCMGSHRLSDPKLSQETIDKIEIAVAAFESALLSYTPDKSVYVVKIEGKYISDLKNHGAQLTSSVSLAKKFEWRRQSNESTKYYYHYEREFIAI